MIFAQGNNSNSNNPQGNTQWKTNGNIADSNHYIGTKNEHPVKFRTYDIERMRITPEGNVGIGTSQPAAKLDVNGDVIFRTSFKLLGLLDAETDVQSFLLIKNDGTVTKGGLDHLKSLMYLDVNATDGSCGDGGVFNDPNPTWSNGLNKIYYKCPQIKVGIGTSTPQTTLDVQGTTFTNKLKIGTQPNTMVGYFHMKLPTSNSNSSTIFLIENNQRALFQINNNGIVRTREVMVNLDTPWPDYVFDKTYQLKPLQEIEDFILQNGHLPNVPTANTVKTEGIALGEMNKILLEKIEELTLYLIKQEKRIEVLEIQLNAKTVGNEK